MATEQLSDKEIFHFARKLDSHEAIETYLDQVCGDDPPRRARILELVAGDKCDSFLEKPPVALPDTVESRANDCVGQTIGRYKLLQRIGEGGFGVVYMAEQAEPVCRQVALKVIKPGMDTKDVIARFEVERQALAMMDHPNIAQVFDGGETEDGHPFFVMELVKGIPLTEFCDENKCDTSERLKLFRMVCRAIQHAHQKGIIHRDIKPSNVMVTLHDGEPVPKVIDFGVSKAIAQKLTAKTLFTAYGQMVGTPLYMSPEQAEMSGLDVDTRSDVYSLGVLLYELLTGTTPLNPKDLQRTAYAELQRMIREDEPPRPSRRLSTLGKQSIRIARCRSSDPKKLEVILRGELDWIVMKCLEKNRERRYDAAKAIADDIDRYLKGDAVIACPPSTAYLIKKVCLKHRGPVLLGTSLFVLILAGLVGTSSGWIAENSARERAERAQRQAHAASNRAIDALKREQTAKRTLEARNRSQALVIAYDAFAVGNIQRARELLQSFVPERGTAWDMPWRFLNERCKEIAPVRIRFDSPTICRVDDPLGRFRIVAIEPSDLVLDTDSGEPLVRLGRKLLPVDLAMSDDGRFLFVACDKHDGHGVIQTWEIEHTEGKVTAHKYSEHRIAGAALRGMVYNNRSNQFIVLMADGTLSVVDAVAGRVIADAQTRQTDHARIRLSPNEDFIVTDGWTQEVQLFDSATLQPLMKIDYPARIHSVEISPDQSHLVICGVEGTEIWNINQQTATRRGRLDYQRSMTCGFSPDGNSLAILNHDQKAISVRSIPSGLELFRIPAQDSTSGTPKRSDLRFHEDEIVLRGRESLNIYPLPVQRNESQISNSFWHAPVAVSPVHPEIAFPGDDGLLNLWNPETNHLRTLGSSQEQPHILTIAYSSDGKQIVIGRAEHNGESPHEGISIVEIWDRADGELVTTITDNETNVWLAKFLPSNNDFVLTSSRSNDIRIYDLTKQPPSFRRVRTPRGKAVVLTAPFSPSGRYVALGGNVWRDKSGLDFVAGELWDLSEPESPRLSRKIDVKNTYSISFSRDGQELACVESRAPQISLIDVTSDLRRSIPVSCTAIMSAIYSPDDQCLVVVVPSGEIKFVDRQNGEELGTFRVNHPLRHVKFMDQFDRLVASTMDDLVMQWKY